MKTDSTVLWTNCWRKEELEKHLKNRLGELFDLDYDLLLYDVTSRYFEGEPSGTNWLSVAIRVITVRTVSRSTLL
jgi:hypothetical protein